jgi:hypothetical protein
MCSQRRDQARLGCGPVLETGRGIDSQALLRIFDLFAQVQPSAAGGLGIGLSVVREIVNLHRGRIQINSSAMPGIHPSSARDAAPADRLRRRGYRRASRMLSEMVCAGTRQKLRATRGGTIAMHATTIQFDTEWLPSAIAARHTRITQVAKIWVFFASEYMRRV